jgi:hypothetical protein
MVSVGRVSTTMVLMPMLAALHCGVVVMCMFADHWVGSSQQQAQTRINQVLALLLLLVVWVIMRLAANSTCCAGQCQWLQHATMNFSESDSGRLCLNPILYSRGLNKWPHLNNRLRARLGPELSTLRPGERGKIWPRTWPLGLRSDWLRGGFVLAGLRPGG